MTASVRRRFEEACLTWPDGVAIEAAEAVTYRALDGLTAQAAGLLESAELRSTVIAILMGDPAAQIAAMLAVLRVGAVFCFLDPRLPVQRLVDMAETAAPAAVITDEACSPLCHSLFERGETWLFLWKARSGMRLLQPGCGEPARLAATRLGTPCYLYFTSGSTGRPKAVLGQDNGLRHFIGWEIETFGLCHADRVSQLTPPTFDVYLRDIFAALCAGGTICLLPDRDLLLDPDGLADWIDRSGVTLIHCVPTLLRGLLLARLDPGRFAALKRVLLAGEQLLPSDVNRWTEIFGDRIELVNLYGPTETTLAKFCYRVPPGKVETLYVPVGKPMPGAQALLLQENLDPCRRGDVGELYIRTPFRSLGYFNEPALTAQAFIQNPFSNHPDDLLYRTGDLATELPDGSYRLTGRRDFQVKLHGMRVELGEIEATFTAYPGIAEAIVVAHEQGSGDLRLSAFCTARTEPGETPDDADDDARVGHPSLRRLIHYLQSRLPAYMIPPEITFVDSLPRNPNGKVDRRALSARRGDIARNGGSYVAPRTELERTLVALWVATLALPASRIGIDDNFFALGGHSMLAVKLVNRIRSELQFELPVRGLFEAPTVALLAERIAILGGMASAQDTQDEEAGEYSEGIL